MRIVFSLAGLVALSYTSACKLTPCDTQITPYTYSFNGIATTGPRAGLPVARFDLEQRFVTHSPIGCDGAPTQDVGVVDLTITSTAPVAQSLRYSVQGMNAVGPVWAWEDTLQRLGPGETRSKPRIAISSYRLDRDARILMTDVVAVPAKVPIESPPVTAR